MSAVITAEHISKRYMIRHEQAERYKTLSGTLSNIAKGTTGGSKEEFWALRDISFEVKQGERVGIIGRNGAGKSTLLKILSRIVTPTGGRVEITGRVASLLEVGTGFHPELSGRENIFLNGAILGMSKSEITRKFDEIVDFAEVEKFLDTPVKRYSSGMYVRLAFAVAAHLEPEILIVDEVLAVGDAAFQKKCLGKMQNVAGEGRTVLFVSHNIGAIRSLCNKAIFLEHGMLSAYGPVDGVIPEYLGVVKKGETDGIRVQAAALGQSGEWEAGTDIEITVSWERGRFQPGWQCDVAVYTIEGVKIFALESEKFPGFSSDDPAANGITFSITNPGYAAKDIRVDVGVKKHKSVPYSIVIENCLMLSPSDKNLPPYKRDDVILIPPATCRPVQI